MVIKRGNRKYNSKAIKSDSRLNKIMRTMRKNRFRSISINKIIEKQKKQKAKKGNNKGIIEVRIKNKKKVIIIMIIGRKKVKKEIVMTEPIRFIS